MTKNNDIAWYSIFKPGWYVNERLVNTVIFFIDPWYWFNC